MKLTEAQREALMRVHNGRVAENRFGYSAWRIVGATPVVVGRLISMGLAERAPATTDTRVIRATAAGRRAVTGE